MWNSNITKRFSAWERLELIAAVQKPNSIESKLNMKYKNYTLNKFLKQLQIN